jgi:hypothetical protein
MQPLCAWNLQIHIFDSDHKKIQNARSLTPADFIGAVFTHVHFQKIAQISSLCNFHYISEWIPSLMHFLLLMTQVLWIWLIRIFVRPKKRMSQGQGRVYTDCMRIFLRAQIAKLVCFLFCAIQTFMLVT